MVSGGFQLELGGGAGRRHVRAIKQIRLKLENLNWHEMAGWDSTPLVEDRLRSGDEEMTHGGRRGPHSRQITWKFRKNWNKEAGCWSVGRNKTRKIKARLTGHLPFLTNTDLLNFLGALVHLTWFTIFFKHSNTRPGLTKYTASEGRVRLV